MNRIKLFLLIIVVFSFFTSCDLQSLLNKVEVNYDVEFDPNDNSSATVSYYNAKGELVTETIEAGDWSYKGIFDDGQQTGVWVESNAQSGTVGVYLVIWYSELNDLEDYVDANTWTLPLGSKVGLESIITRVKTYPVSYKVTVEGTNGVPVKIQYTDKDYDSQSLLSEASKADGVWTYNGNFPVGGYASVTVSSEATSGTATIDIFIDYDDKAVVTDQLIVDFSTTTKTGSLGFPVE